MKRYLINTVIFLLGLFILVFILAWASSYAVQRRGFKNWHVEGNLLMMKKDKHYDLLIMGISHARNFSRYNNHQRLEKMLDCKIINIGIGEGRCGAIDQNFYLDYFYDQGNTTRKILYVVSPPLLTKDFLNTASNTFNLEPFRADFFWQYLHYPAENKYQRLFYYVKSKFSHKWLNLKPKSKKSRDDALEALDSAKIREGLKLLLVNGERIDEFKENCITVENTINLARANHSEIIFIVPPALFGKWQGHYEIMDFLKEMKVKYGTRYYDLSESVLVPEYYYDHHHLNTAGIEYFTQNYLKDIIDQ